MSTGYYLTKKRLVKGIKIFLKKKNKRYQYASEQHRNLPEDEKQRLIECRKKLSSNNKKEHWSILLLTALYRCMNETKNFLFLSGNIKIF